ncbi:hypothetical protein CHIBA101_1718 [Actinomyces sp. Chiba101]|nr:hypothetical protein CHIBA101_1718 [Actinomyces sp. Chiba101]
MARLRRLLPAWETYSPLIEVPERLVTGVSPDVGGQVGSGVEGAFEGLGDEHGVGACHHHGLGSQGVDDRSRPGGVVSGSVGLGRGVHAGPPGLAQGGGGGPGGDDLKDGVVLEPGP